MTTSDAPPLDSLEYDGSLESRDDADSVILEARHTVRITFFASDIFGYSSHLLYRDKSVKLLVHFQDIMVQPLSNVYRTARQWVFQRHPQRRPTTDEAKNENEISLIASVHVM
jgi:hypothetical protein